MMWSWYEADDTIATTKKTNEATAVATATTTEHNSKGKNHLKINKIL